METSSPIDTKKWAKGLIKEKIITTIAYKCRVLTIEVIMKLGELEEVIDVHWFASYLVQDSIHLLTRLWKDTLFAEKGKGEVDTAHPIDNLMK